jgi:hypothetical protein
MLELWILKTRNKLHLLRVYGDYQKIKRITNFTFKDYHIQNNL